MFLLDASLPFAARVNVRLATQQRMSFQQIYNQTRSEFAGDELAGALTPGASIPYDALTWLQQQIVADFEENDNAAAPASPGLPADFEVLLIAHAGPNEIWNLGYDAMGMDPSKPLSSLLRVVTGVEPVSGNSVRVIIPA